MISYRLVFCSPRNDVEAMAEALEQHSTAVGMEDHGRDWLVEAWFADPPDEDRIRASLEQAARETGAAMPAWHVEMVAQQDWVARSLAGLKPVHAGRFVVHGFHDSGFTANAITIGIDAGLAFGTGHHGTTMGCLLAIGQHLKQAAPLNCLDLGSGTGVLAIALAKRLKRPVLASDIDPVAVRVARQNVRVNQVTGLVRVVTANGFRHVELARKSPFDLIVANILARPLAEMAVDAAGALAPDGTIILSGLLVAQERRVRAAYRQQGLVLKRRIIREGWTTLTLRRACQGGS
jgi:ribosomal protein L11 methyltransferase